MAEEISSPSIKRRRNLGAALFILGLFLIGGAIIYYLTTLQQKALDPSKYVFQPAVMTYAAPKLSLTSLSAQPVSLADYHGKVLLVNNWATWCPPCQTEMPELQVYYQKHAAQGLVVVGIESGEDAATVSKFVSDYKISFPIWLDLKGKALEAFKNWDLPSSYVIDKNGMVQLSWTGPVNQATLEKYVTPLLEK